MGALEHLIDLHKSQHASGRPSCRAPLANQIRLILDTAAFRLMLAVYDNIPKTDPLAIAEFATLREKLFKTGARVSHPVQTVKINPLFMKCLYKILIEPICAQDISMARKSKEIIVLNQVSEYSTCVDSTSMKSPMSTAQAARAMVPTVPTMAPSRVAVPSHMAVPVKMVRTRAARGGAARGLAARPCKPGLLIRFGVAIPSPHVMRFPNFRTLGSRRLRSAGSSFVFKQLSAQNVRPNATCAAAQKEIAS